MNTSTAFRSHLMQQFAAVARNQAKPPLAMIGWLAEDDQRFSTATLNASNTAAAAAAAPTMSTGRDLSSIGTAASSSSLLHHRVQAQDSSRLEDRLLLSSTASAKNKDTLDFSQRLISSLAEEEEDGEEESTTDTRRQDSHTSNNGPLLDQVELSAAFQNLLQTRRTNGKFIPSSPIPSATEASYWRMAMERAVLCGFNAPNHKRTEPFTFKRMIGPSANTARLAEIAYQVSMRQQLEAQPKTGASLEQIREKANKKRAKWSQIPAFLVTLLTSKHAVVDQETAATTGAYEELPFSPPTTERDLEDYAAASAAVQNVLLSLHSEHLGSKWVTGPVIRTPAFRELVQAAPQDRVVSLVMIGRADETKRVPKRRRRRELHGDVLVDL